MRQVLIDRTSRIDAIDLWAISPASSASRVLASDCSLDSGVVSLVSSSARVVYAALAGDLAVAAAKFGASALSGSSAMLTEAIHSLVVAPTGHLRQDHSRHRENLPNRQPGKTKQNDDRRAMTPDFDCRGRSVEGSRIARQRIDGPAVW